MSLGKALAYFPLLRNLETSAVYLVVDLHHAIFDDWSHDRFLQMVERTYYDSSESPKSISE
jgi:NRPS condensation-like uncharacterized protein